MELLDLKENLDHLGEVTMTLADGSVYACHEQAIYGRHEQDVYNEAKKIYERKKRIVDAYFMIALFEMAQHD